MGVYDRDYYRNDPPGGKLMGGVAPVCKWLIAINVAVFIMQLLTLDSPGSGLTGWLFLAPDRVIEHWELWRLVTYAFCHSTGGPSGQEGPGLMHLVGNMYFLWIMGNQVEPIYGQREFLRFYLTAALISGLGFLGFQLVSGSPAASLGASGAVMAVTMLCAMYYPSMKILFMFIIPVELRWLVPLYIVFDMYPMLMQLGSGRAIDHVAHSAHLAGLAYGYLYKHFDLRYSRLLAGWSWPRLKRLVKTSPIRRSEKVRLYEPPEERTATSDLKIRVDEILAKISAQGESSLTEREREILKEASRRFKKR
jgi:membrane associated rhomboid family serine protease